ncbi:MAG: 4Fe-4S dicluster domain-containing protein [Bacteroidales bacterium]|nr:4Fe-4S dicluster domain-containing protein [Bacteroidales bacterium]
MNGKYFIIPFLAGMAYLFLILIVRGIRWISGLSKIDKLRLFQSLKSGRTLKSLKEAFVEGLLHRKIFLKNPVLGYMHMSLAFGWFLLIVMGHVEAMVAEGSLSVPFYMPIFFRYFKTTEDFPLARFFSFMMDLLLLFVLSGVGLAMLKRFKKSLFGMKRTTRLKLFDRIALTSLWLIFPLRLLAESIAAAISHNGSFLTSGIGKILSSSQHIELLNTPAWLAYSLVLGFFFIALPNSRYMHIPAEILFIFLRNSGIRLKKQNTTYTDVQVFSCSRCGICLDNCQLSTAGIRDTQSVYLLKNIRNKDLDDEHLFNCLLCGKCQIDCPVGIETIDLRITQRIESTRQYNSSYEYLEINSSPSAKVVYFAGCMTHLTPGIITAMQKIFETAGENYWFFDQEKAPCCGRPLMLAGQYEAASKLIENNSRQILASGAQTLVVSCPICYKVFKEDYHLFNMEVLMHFEYIRRLIDREILQVARSPQRLLYHDPCELGRGMGMYKEPREVLAMTGTLVSIRNEKEKAYCCGGSLGNLKIKQEERDMIRNQAVNDYLEHSPDMLVTSCPMCKKTFARNTRIPVLDISEIITRNMLSPGIPGLTESKECILEEEYI